MIKIPLTRGTEAIIDDCDKHLSEYKWHICNRGYAIRSYKDYNGVYQKIFLHHAVMGRPLNKLQIDHINGNQLDNRRQNLRFVTNRQNGQNRKEHRGEKIKASKFIGVTFNKGKWTSSIKINGSRIYLGYFSNEDDAGKSYIEAVKNLK